MDGNKKMTITVKILDSIDEIDVDHYTTLKNQCGGSVFYDIRFLRAAEKSPLLLVEKIYYLVAYDAEKIIAFMPSYQQISPDPFGILTKTTAIQFESTDCAFFNHIMHCYESMILAENQSNELYQLLLSHLKKLAEEKDVKYYGLINVMDKNLMDTAKKMGFQVNFMWDRFYIDFSLFKQWDDFLFYLKRKGRQLFRNQLTKFEQSGATVIIEKPPFINLNEVTELCYLTTKKYGTEHYYPQKAFAEFITTCDDLIRLISVYFQGKRVGVVIAFLEEKKLHLWACGMSYDDISFSPYIVAIAEGFQYAMKHHIPIVEIGRTNGKMKEKLGFKPLPLYSIINNANSSENPHESI